jgi:hypothetical protein
LAEKETAVLENWNVVDLMTNMLPSACQTFKLVSKAKSPIPNVQDKWAEKEGHLPTVKHNY